MSFPFSEINIEHDSAEPLYLQIASQLKRMLNDAQPEQLSKMNMEELQLPSIRNFANDLQVAVGTIQQTYNLLEQENVIYRVSGKGTFFRIPPDKSELSRIDQASEVMDRMIQRLDQLGFSDREKQIYFDLKMRERDIGYHSLKIGIIDSSSEIRTVLQNSIADISNLEIFRYPLDELAFSGADLLCDLDLIVTSISCYQRLNSILESFSAQIEVAVLGLQYSLPTICQLSKLRPDQRITVVAQSRHFARIMQRAVEQIVEPKEPVRSFVLSKEESIELDGPIDQLLIPEQLIYFTSNEMQEKIAYLKRHAVNRIDFDYVCQDGSLLYVQRTIDRMKKDKKANF